MTEFRFGYLLNALIFAVLGLLVFAAALSVIDRFTPARIWKAIVEEKNIALAILVGAISIGMCLIVAAAMH